MTKRASRTAPEEGDQATVRGRGRIDEPVPGSKRPTPGGVAGAPEPGGGGRGARRGEKVNVILVPTTGSWIFGAALQGLGTAMVYATLLAAIGDQTRPDWRASALGVYRFWRDLGYAAGALLSGLIADLLGMAAAIHVVAPLTLASGLWVAARLPGREDARATVPAA